MPIGVVDEGRQRLAGALAWPVLADPRSGLRYPGAGVVVCAADGILRAPEFAAAHRPDIVLALGERWASKVVTAFVAGSPRVVVDPTGSWPDPERSAGHLVRCDPTLLCEALAAAAVAARAAPRSTTWASAWADAERAALDAILAAVDNDYHYQNGSETDTPGPPGARSATPRRTGGSAG